MVFYRHDRHKPCKPTCFTTVFGCAFLRADAFHGTTGMCLTLRFHALLFSDKGLLGSIKGVISLSGFVGGQFLPPPDPSQNAFDFIRVGAFKVLALFAEAFTPDFHHADLVADDIPCCSCTIKLATAQKAPSLIKIHAIPVFR